MRISDWSSDVCSSDLIGVRRGSPSYAGRTGPYTRDRPRAPRAGAGHRVCAAAHNCPTAPKFRSEEHTSELQSLMRISYAVFCLKKKTTMQIFYIKKQMQSYNINYTIL